MSNIVVIAFIDDVTVAVVAPVAPEIANSDVAKDIPPPEPVTTLLSNRSVRLDSAPFA